MICLGLGALLRPWFDVLGASLSYVLGAKLAGPQSLPLLGLHTVRELYGCNAKTLADEALVLAAAGEAVLVSNATLLSISSHDFDVTAEEAATPSESRLPVQASGGVTVLALLSESHLSIHTWPEHGYAAVDMFTCGNEADPVAAVDFLANRLECTSWVGTNLARGNPSGWASLGHDVRFTLSSRSSGRDQLYA
jgi:S-adenosylmethionine decarboxylase